MGVVVVDPGHGGRRRVGRSTPNHVCGEAGSLEKVLTLSIAERLVETGRPDVVLTRYDDSNPSLRQRAQVAQRIGADAFISLHFGNEGSGPRVFVHPRAGQASLQLAKQVGRSLEPVVGSGALLARAPLAVLSPDVHASKTATCLVEISNLADPAEERRLGTKKYRAAIARALRNAWRIGAGSTKRSRARRTFDLWHEVPLLPQETGMSCWAAAAAMIIGWRDRLAVEPREVARGGGRWREYRRGLLPHDVPSLADAWDLTIEEPRQYGVDELRTMLLRNGPLWCGEADPGLHVVVITGIYGDGSDDNTWLRINDPWPIGRGERYALAFETFARNFAAARTLGGVHVQILHGGR